MKSIDIEKEKVDLFHLFDFARTEPVLLLAYGEEFIISRADSFDDEVKKHRNSKSFQAFLDRRMKCKIRFPIEDIEKEIEKELQEESKKVKPFNLQLNQERD